MTRRANLAVLEKGVGQRACLECGQPYQMTAYRFRRWCSAKCKERAENHRRLARKRVGARWGIKTEADVETVLAQLAEGWPAKVKSAAAVLVAARRVSYRGECLWCGGKFWGSSSKLYCGPEHAAEAARVRRRAWKEYRKLHDHPQAQLARYMELLDAARRGEGATVPKWIRDWGEHLDIVFSEASEPAKERRLRDEALAEARRHRAEHERKMAEAEAERARQEAEAERAAAERWHQFMQPFQRRADARLKEWNRQRELLGLPPGDGPKRDAMHP
jgi:hypothetical protein